MSAVRFYIKLIEHPKQGEQDANWEFQLYDRQKTEAGGLVVSGMYDTAQGAFDAAIAHKQWVQLTEHMQW